jgi:hypothetical protein
VRFEVATVSGHRASGGNGNPPGLSCHVLDRAYNYRVVMSFRSEDRRRGNRSLGCDAALANAQALVDELNRLDAADLLPLDEGEL